MEFPKCKCGKSCHEKSNQTLGYAPNFFLLALKMQGKTKWEANFCVGVILCGSKVEIPLFLTFCLKCKILFNLFQEGGRKSYKFVTFVTKKLQMATLVWQLETADN